MATSMLNFGGKVHATVISQQEESCMLIPVRGTSSEYFDLRTERDDGSTVIVFSIVLNTTGTDNINVDLCLLEDNQYNKPVYVGKSVTVVPGRPVSLDYKINMRPNNALCVCATEADKVHVVVSAVQL